MPTNINRNTSGVVLPPEVAREIWQPTVDESVRVQMSALFRQKLIENFCVH